MNLLLNRINKRSEIRPVDQMTDTVNNARYFPHQLLHIIVNNEKKSRRKEPSQF